jgi:hypothetical protein
MKTNFFIIAILSVVLFFSCQTGENELAPASNDDFEKIEFTYKGNFYSSNFYYKDAIMVIENAEVDDIYQKISSIPDLATFVKENGAIYYFDSYNEQMEYLEKNFKPEGGPTTRADADADPYCILSLYKNINYGSTRLEFTTTSSRQGDLRDNNFNDELSSFRMAATVPYMVTFYRDKDFGGATITFHTLPITNQVEVANLGGYNCSSNRTWNDQATCYKLIKWL